jgi:predicted permease
MQKALLISILFATVLIPLVAARGGSVKSAVRRSAIATSAFCVLYWLGLVFVYPTLSSGKPTHQQMENADQPAPQ